MGYITVIARVSRDLWQRKQTLSSGCALGLGSFTAINPWHPCYNYYKKYENKKCTYAHSHLSTSLPPLPFLSCYKAQLHYHVFIPTLLIKYTLL